jgi:Putative binding domain, N-terminal
VRPGGHQDGIMRKHGIWVLAAFMVTAPLTSRVAAAATIMVGVGDSLQAAIDSANPGDVILLHAGVTFTGNFVIRSSKHSITIRSSADDSLLPAAGQRTSPDYWQYLPKLQSPSNVAALKIEPGASYITLMHLEILASGNGSANLIELGAADSRQTSVAQAPHHLVLDRLLVNIPASAPQRRAIALNSGDTQILGCYLAGLKYAGSDAQAIAGWNGPGPFLIENNYLEGAAENVLFGGGDPTIPGLVPTNIRILRNHLSKPLSWKGSSWTVKNLLELKNAQDVLIEGNLLEYNWLAAQSGYSILFTPRNQSGGNPNTVVQRVKFVNNKVRHVSAVFSILGRDTNYPSQLTNDIEIRNNVFEDVSKATYGGTGRLMLIDGGDNIRIANNTSINTGTAIYVWGHQVTNFVVENTILNHGDYGIMGANSSPGNATLAMWFPGAVVIGNVMPNNPWPGKFPTGNSYPKDWASVGFVDLAGGNYRLAPSSLYFTAGTMGSTPGANIDALEAAMTAGTPPAPVCSFSVTPLAHTSPAEGDSFTVNITASAATCAWTTMTDAAWVQPSTAGGTGSAAVTVTVDPNATSVQRTGTVTIAGTAVTVTEAAAPPPCSFTLSPTVLDVPAAGGSFTVTLTATDGSCAWTASSNQTWTTLTTSSSTGSATLTVNVDPNTTTAQRSATVTVGGLALAITQAGGNAPTCSFTLVPSSITAPAAGTTVVIATLTASSSACPWTAQASAQWISLSALSGTGSANITVSISPNTANGTRNGTATVAGLTITVQQFGTKRKSSSRVANRPTTTTLAGPITVQQSSTRRSSGRTANRPGTATLSGPITVQQGITKKSSGLTVNRSR